MIVLVAALSMVSCCGNKKAEKCECCEEKCECCEAAAAEVAPAEVPAEAPAEAPVEAPAK